MIAVKEILTSSIRRVLVGADAEYEFLSVKDKDVDIDLPRKSGLYIHVPFCESMCPYCPYFKVKYDKNKAKLYKEALLKEIDLYSQRVEGVEFESLYFGGGTPTLIIDELEEIVFAIRNKMNFKGTIALETSVKSIDKLTLDKLENLGVDLLSVGIQSFEDDTLKLLGRNYDSELAKSNLSLLQNYNFKTINFDMIFITPDQGENELNKDLETSLSFKPDQLTIYPLLTFPYSSIGKYCKLNKMKLPSIFKRRKMYYQIHDFLTFKGYDRTSVWSFNRNDTSAYSSVTRDYYLGLGPGAGSYTKSSFIFNCFDVEQYCKMLLNENRLAAALRMRVTEPMAKLFWLYWRFYETTFSYNGYKTIFDKNVSNDYPWLNIFLKIFRFAKVDRDKVCLTRRGAHWIHLCQNFFALDYISKIWSECIKEPFPNKVKI